jgi:hypothetical protein
MDDILSVVFEFIVVYIFYWPGRIILKFITLGRYPPAKEVQHNEQFVAGIGFIAFLGVLLAMLASSSK